jgi:4-aminobutyrate aminotransferase
MNDVVRRARQHLTPALTFDTELNAIKGEGATVSCDDGKTYLDFSCGTAVANIGYNPPRVVAAAKKQLDNLMHSGCVYYYESLARLGELMAEITPEGIEKFFFSNSGAEAVEGSMKLAHYVTQRPAMMCFLGAFHGRTYGAASLTTSNSKYRRRYEPLLSAVYRIPFPHCYRCPMGLKEETCSVECMDFLYRAFRHEVAADQLAALIMEPIQGEHGVVPCPKKYMDRLVKILRENGILLIFDEVQTGFGRTCNWFAADHYGVAPDIMAVAKGIASGLPLSAVCSTSKIMDQWSPGAHGTTFGGNPVSCAAGVATIETIREEKMLEKSRKISLHVTERLHALKEKFACVGDVRGLGYMMGVEFVKDRKTKEPDGDTLKALLKGCEENQLIMINCGPFGNILRFYPPLCVTQEQIDRGIDIIEKVLAKACQK